MRGAHLLLVDDDEDDYLIVRSLLDEISRGSYQLDWVNNYERGEATLRENRHSLCLMDYQLGARDGIELLQKANELGFEGPIIILTGMAQGSVDMRALNAGAVDYLVKDGLTAEQLARSIRYALARREMELERVERLRAEAENRSKSEFLAHLSHELRTPLSAILGFTELLINKTQELESQTQLQIVHRNGKHLLGLLNDILDLSKIEAGKLELEIQPVNLISLLTDIYALMRAVAVDKNLTFELTATQPLPMTIHTDPTRLRQVLLNLIGNAVKFTDEGGVRVTVWCRALDDFPRLEFSVADTGVGIHPSCLESIFQPFVQIKNARMQTRAGTGLGLAISRQLVERLGGEIHVRSEEHSGSEFRFSINPGDLTGVSMRELALTHTAIQESPPELPKFKGHVLVVDDLRDIRTLIGHYVTGCGLDVAYAGNGAEALATLEKQKATGVPFDLVLMDIHMPVMDGVTAVQTLRRQGHNCPVVALTAAHMKGDRERYLAAGFSECLSKPIDQQRMTRCLARYFFSGPVDQHSGVRQSEERQLLVVDDVEDALAATCALLELLGWQTLRATTGRQALRLLHSAQPTAALVDLNLPDMDGYLLCEQLHERLPSMQLVVVSGQAVEAERVRFPLAGALLKPISANQLQNVLASF